MKLILIFSTFFTIKLTFKLNEHKQLLYNEFQNKTAYCDSIDSYFKRLMSSNVDSIILYKSFNYIAGPKGLLIWKENNLYKLIKFTTASRPFDSIDSIASINENLRKAADEYFDLSPKIDFLHKGEIESMHDSETKVISFSNGVRKFYHFQNSILNNNSDELPKVFVRFHSFLYYE